MAAYVRCSLREIFGTDQTDRPHNNCVVESYLLFTCDSSFGVAVFMPFVTFMDGGVELSRNQGVLWSRLHVPLSLSRKGF